MSEFLSTVRSFHLHGPSDSDSDTETLPSSRRDKRRQLPQQSPCQAPVDGSTSDTKISQNSAASGEPGNHGSSMIDMSQTGGSSPTSTLPDPKTVNKYDKINRSVSFSLLEKDRENHSPGPPGLGQRKLPNGVSVAGSSAGLKGILIKPKRLLPAQPDTSKVKRLLQESSHYKPTARSEDKKDKVGDKAPEELGTTNSQPQSVQGLNQAASTVDASVPANADVGKLKLYFKKYGLKKPASANASSGRQDTDENKQHSDMNRSQSENVGIPELNEQGGYLTRERTIYDFNDQGLSKVEEWCSQERNTSDTKMAADPSIVNKLKLGIRSPSPRSSTTWDRSSSGYSSDERQDPRSPPPPSTTDSSSMKSSPDTLESPNGPLAVRLERELNLSANVDIGGCDVTARSRDSRDFDRYLTATKSASVLDDREAPSPDVCSHTILEAVHNSSDGEDCECRDKPQRDTPDPYGQSGVSDTVLDALSAASRQQTTLRRPVPGWTSSQTNGRIQYRKSGSESVISLRHSNGRNNTDLNTGGLEVFGKSCRQPTVTSSGDVTETRADIGQRGDNCPPERVLTTPQSDFTPQDFPIRPKTLRRKPMDLRSPQDMKSLNLNVNLSLPKDEKDIRKSLHDLNSPRRRSTAGKTAPIRARHPVHVTPNQPTASPVPAASQSKPLEEDGKPGIKFFGKKMWRAPSGQPEGSTPRPFSPFGGTLPPSKIKKKQIHEVLV